MTDRERVEVVAELDPTGETPQDMAESLGQDLRGTTSYDVMVSAVHETAYLVKWPYEVDE